MLKELGKVVVGSGLGLAASVCVTAIKSGAKREKDYQDNAKKKEGFEMKKERRFLIRQIVIDSKVNFSVFELVENESLLSKILKIKRDDEIYIGLYGSRDKAVEIIGELKKNDRDEIL